jgi:hypothetical protein
MVFLSNFKFWVLQTLTKKYLEQKNGIKGHCRLNKSLCTI